MTGEESWSREGRERERERKKERKRKGSSRLLLAFPDLMLCKSFINSAS